jgi:diguanylate cyclase (GGDEF)-like protein
MYSKTKKILVIQKEDTKKNIFNKSFKDHEMFFSNALEALELLREHDFSLCIVANEIETKDKLSLVKQVGQISENRIPSIVILNPEEESICIQFIEKGASDYLFSNSINSFILCLTGTKVIEQKKWELIYQDLARESSNEISPLKNKTTNLYNNYYLITRIQEELTRSKRYHFPLSLITFKIDDFENFQTRFNQTEINLLIREMAHIFTNDLRSSDLLAMIDRNQFAVLLPHTNTEQASIVWKRMLSHTKNHPFMINKENVYVNLKATVTSLNEEVEKIDNYINKMLDFLNDTDQPNDELVEFNL